MSRSFVLKLTVVLTVMLVIALAGMALAAKPTDPGGGGGGGNGGKPTTEYTNNLSFPVIAADGKQIVPVTTATWTTAYTGPYEGLTADEYLIATSALWYAQKVDGNTWQGGYYNAAVGETVVVHGMDWGDNIQSVNPTIGRPYRLETGLFAVTPTMLLPGTAAAGNAYGMVMLSYPSSPQEVQGTNETNTYTSAYTTITSGVPGLKIQNITNKDATALSWNASTNLWDYTDPVTGAVTTPTNTAISFAPELNVAGKYIFGASTGGWKPTALGTYRITFYIPPASSSIRMDTATTIGNLVAGVWYPMGTEPVEGVVAAAEPEEEGAVATPMLDVANNLSYVDVTVIAKGGRN